MSLIFFQAGIHSEQLSLALEPEAASLFCRFLPVKKIHGVNGVSDISNLAPGNRYLVLDAGGTLNIICVKMPLYSASFFCYEAGYYNTIDSCKTRSILGTVQREFLKLALNYA